MSVISRVKSWLGWGAEGSVRGPFYGTGEWGTAFPIQPLEDGWNRNLDVDYDHARSVAIVYACCMLYSRAISQCAPQHLSVGSDGGDERQRDSAAARVLRYPNDYETWTQFVAQLTSSLMFDGETLALKVRDNRGTVIGLHKIPRNCWSIHVEPDTKAIFYGINQADLFEEPDMLVPARDVVHIRMYCPRHPLIGESPIKAAAMAVGINVSLNRSQLAFFSQMSRPSGVLSTDAALTKEQMQQLRTAFAEQSKLWQQGGTPILSNGLKWQGVNITQSDSQLIEQQKLSALDVARVYGVPMALLSEGSGPQGGTEALISAWLSIGLGSVIENIERSLDRCFDLPVGEHIQLDPAPLLRVDFQRRIEGYARASQGGIMTPNEIRQKEGLRRIEGGDSVYMQRQMTAIDVLQELAAAELAGKLTANEPPPPEPEPIPEPDVEKSKAVVINLIHKKRAAND